MISCGGLPVICRNAGGSASSIGPITRRCSSTVCAPRSSEARDSEMEHCPRSTPVRLTAGDRSALNQALAKDPCLPRCREYGRGSEMGRGISQAPESARPPDLTRPRNPDALGQRSLLRHPGLVQAGKKGGFICGANGLDPEIFDGF